MSDAPTYSLSDIVALSEAMLRCAECDEWLELASLEAKRQTLIAAVMRTPDAATRDAYQQAARRILALDQHTETLAQAGQSALVKQLQNFSIGRSAVQAYAQQAR